MGTQKTFVSSLSALDLQIAVAALCFFYSATCMAAPEEIQVYLDEFAEPGKFGLDLHTNYVLSARTGSVNRRMLRVTPELSYGINENWEGALYWLTSVGPAQLDGHPVTDGVKIRAKWRPRAPTPDSPWYGAINIELGQLSRRFYPDRTSAEVKLIGVYDKGPLILGVNVNLDRALRTNAQQPTTTEIDTKIAYRVLPANMGDLRFGFENYSFLGAIRTQPVPGIQTSSSFLVADFSFRRWDFNVGFGKVSGATTDRWLLKAIVGVPLD